VKIKRTTANKIMSLANQLADDCLLGIMSENEKLIQVYTDKELKQVMSAYPESILVYNQSPQSIQIRDTIEYSDGQKNIEVFQETKGVFGLRAYRQIGKIQTPVTLELSD